MRYKAITILLILIFVGIMTYLKLVKTNFANKSPDKIKINDTTLNIIYARTEQEKMRGLGYRDSLDQNTGMLFVYQAPKVWTFWMQGMRFALDFLWIEKNQVADITENVLPPSQTNNQPLVIQPKVPVSLILEVNAGWIKEHNIKVGDPVVFN